MSEKSQANSSDKRENPYAESRRFTRRANAIGAVAAAAMLIIPSFIGIGKHKAEQAPNQDPITAVDTATTSTTLPEVQIDTAVTQNLGEAQDDRTGTEENTNAMQVAPGGATNIGDALSVVNTPFGVESTLTSTMPDGKKVVVKMLDPAISNVQPAPNAAPASADTAMPAHVG